MSGSSLITRDRSWVSVIGIIISNRHGEIESTGHSRLAADLTSSSVRSQTGRQCSIRDRPGVGGRPGHFQSLTVGRVNVRGREEVVEMVGAALMFRDKVLLPIPPALSITLKVMPAGPKAAVGVPPITPVEGFRVNPGGQETRR